MRYDVTVEMKSTHLFAIEADDPMNAMGLALAQMSQQAAEKIETSIEVEVGNG